MYPSHGTLGKGERRFMSTRRLAKPASRLGSAIDIAGRLSPFSGFSDELETWTARYPATVRDAIALGPAMWPLAFERAIAAGLKDSDKLADLGFFMHYPKRNGRAIVVGEPGAAEMIALWKFLRNAARNMLRGHSSTGPSSRSSARPPGLPSYARTRRARGSALPDIEAFAKKQRLGSVFVKTVVQMAKTESGGTYARPAVAFNALPEEKRGGKRLVTAWGAFQYNRDAWTCLISAADRPKRISYVPNGTPGCSGCRGGGGCVFPWDSTPREEIELPIVQYAGLFRAVLAVGGTELDAAGSLRLFHITPAGFRAWLKRAKRVGCSAAWRTRSARQRARVRRFLGTAGVRSPAGVA